MDAISEGHYYRKQLGCKSGIIAWSHGSRFQVGLRLLGESAHQVLDYGSGDGTFLAMASGRIQHGCGADIVEGQVVEARSRLAEFKNLQFCTIGELGDGSHDGKYDVVTCMETLEHCTAPIVEIVLSDLVRLVKPSGRIIISVPIEIGPSFVLKSVVRKVAAWRGLSDYRFYESYKFRDSLRMIFAGQNTKFERPAYGDPGSETHSHYGFNWRALRQRVRAHMTVEQTMFSPLGFLGGLVSSQAWFVCRPKGAV